jgi:hypothetical protein
LRIAGQASLGNWSVGQIVVDPVHSHIFVSRPSENAVDVLSFAGQLLKTITGESDPSGMVVDTATNSLYTADGDHEIGKIGLLSLRALAPVATSGGFVGMNSLTLCDGLIWAGLGGAHYLASVVPSTGAVQLFASEYPLSDLWLAPPSGNGSEFFAGTQDSTVSEVEVVTVSDGVPTITKTLAGGGNLKDLAATSNGRYVAVAHDFPYNFTLDSTTGGANVTLPGAAFPTAVATSPGQGGLVATIESGSENFNLSVYHVGSTKPFSQSTTTGYSGNYRSPVLHGLAISPTGSLVFALSKEGGDLSFQAFSLTPGKTSTAAAAYPKYPDIDTISNIVAIVSFPPGYSASGTITFGSPGKVPLCSDVRVTQVGDYAGAVCQITARVAGTYSIVATYSGFELEEASTGTASVIFHDPGYRTVSSNGTVDSFNVTPHGSHTGTIPSPIVGFGADHETGGYWLVSARGDVYGIDAPFLGSLPDSHVSVPRPVRAIAGTADGRGYWLLDADGTVYAYGDATKYGHVTGVPSTGATVDLVPTADDGGYWIVGSQGQVFPFGNTNHYGDLLSKGITASDIVALAATPNDGGYVIVGADGSTYTFGNAVNHGSLKNKTFEAVVGAAFDPTTGGYWLAVSGGGVYPFDAPGLGSSRSAIVGLVTG